MGGTYQKGLSLISSYIFISSKLKEDTIMKSYLLILLLGLSVTLAENERPIIGRLSDLMSVRSTY